MSDVPDSSNSIAVIGMAGRFPQAASTAEFWENLCNGTDCITTIEDEQLEPLDKHLHAGNNHYVKRAAIVDGADEFDAAFFDIFPSKAVSMDPQHRLFIECCWHAIEDAGYSPAESNHSIGVYAGCYMNTYILDALKKNPSVVHDLANVFHGGSFQNEIGFEKDYLATQVSYYLDLHGPSLTIQTACSTSLVAIATACQSLVNGEADMALAGAATLRFPQYRGYLYEEGGMMSRLGRCSVFDNSADGTLFGNGVAAVLLKPLKTAQQDGDNIYAVIRGWGLNNDGRRKNGYTAPSPEGQIEAIEKAQKMAGFDGSSITMVEAHGTGTPLGDPIEVEALSRVFERNHRAKQYCAIGSVKSNIGHLDCAAGIAGLIKTALSIYYQKIPASLHFSESNSSIDFENSPFFVNTSLLPWDCKEGPRRAGLSSFGVGGTNAHVLLEQAPGVVAPLDAKRQHVLLTLSARDPVALSQQASRLQAHLETHESISMPGVSRTLSAGRSVFSHRQFVVANSRTDAIEKLRQVSVNTASSAQKPAGSENVCFMFPGQGSQYIRMGQDFYQQEPAFRSAFQLCSEILHPHLEQTLETLLFEGDPTSPAWKEKITQTRFAQPLIAAISYSLAQLWISWGVKPTSVIGHSVGEFMAGCISGIFTVEEALNLVAARGQLMQKLPAGQMIAVLANAQSLHSLVQDVDIAACNSPQLTVLSGTNTAIAAAQSMLREQDIVTQKVHTSHAFHSAMMDPIVNEFRCKINEIELHEATIPMLSTVTGTWLGDDEASSADYWAANIRKTVQFSQAMLALESETSGYLLEVGPGQTLTRLARQHAGIRQRHWVLPTCAHPKADTADLEVCYNSVGELWKLGYPIDTRAVGNLGDVQKERLPGYPFQRKKYWYLTESKENKPREKMVEQRPVQAVMTTGSSSTYQYQEDSRQGIVDKQLELMKAQLDALQSDRQS
ncbi:MAG: type I polyketide synthase [Granulosicoccus sp.]